MSLGAMMESITIDATSKIGYSSMKTQRLSLGLKATRLIRTCCTSHLLGMKGNFQIEVHAPP